MYKFDPSKHYAMINLDSRSCMDWMLGDWTFIQETDDTHYLFHLDFDGTDEWEAIDKDIELDIVQAQNLIEYQPTMYILRDPEADPSGYNEPVTRREAERLYEEWHGLYGANDEDEVGFDDIWVKA